MLNGTHAEFLGLSTSVPALRREFLLALVTGTICYSDNRVLPERLEIPSLGRPPFLRGSDSP